MKGRVIVGARSFLARIANCYTALSKALGSNKTLMIPSSIVRCPKAFLLLALYACSYGCVHNPEVLREDLNDLGSYRYKLNLEYFNDGESKDHILYLDNPIEYTGQRNCYIEKPDGIEFCGLHVGGWWFLERQVTLTLATQFTGPSLVLAGVLTNGQVSGDAVLSHWRENIIGTFGIASLSRNEE